jgi:hypothetical protein
MTTILIHVLLVEKKRQEEDKKHISDVKSFTSIFLEKGYLYTKLKNYHNIQSGNSLICT